MKNHLQIKKLTLTALFTAVAVVGSMFSSRYWAQNVRRYSIW